MTPAEWNDLMGTIVVVVIVLAFVAISIWGKD
jgi:hypothetical protein